MGNIVFITVQDVKYTDACQKCLYRRQKSLSAFTTHYAVKVLYVKAYSRGDINRKEGYFKLIILKIESSSKQHVYISTPLQFLNEAWGL